jgi:hypothetical protein
MTAVIPSLGRGFYLFGAVALLAGTALVAPLWLPLMGTFLVVDEPVAAADVALVLDGSGSAALQGAEAWRQASLVRDVVVVEGPIKTHALVAYWSDLVRQGLAPPAPTPAEHLRVVRTSGENPATQARAALPAVQELRARSVLTVGGWLGSRVARRQLESVFGPAGVSVHLTHMTAGGRDPARWYQDAQDRRAVLDLWLQLLFPFLGSED